MENIGTAMAMAMPQPHVLIFPLPLQGPVNCMLKLAELLCLDDDICITFLNSSHIQNRLQICTNTLTYFKQYPNFRFQTIPDGLPEGNPRTPDQIPDLLYFLETVAPPFINRMQAEAAAEGDCGRPGLDIPLTCIISDGAFAFVTGIAREIGVPLLYFDTISPCGFWTCLRLPQLIQAGEFPFEDDDMDAIIDHLPGMEGIIRRRDLPDFYRANDINDPAIRIELDKAKHMPLAQGFIFNTFFDLEAPVLSQIKLIYRNVYVLGPLHTLLKARLQAETSLAIHTTSSNSIWKEDLSCISWLDAQPLNSAVYVSIGSLSAMTKEQFLEIWHGLVNSGSRFLWVRRQDSVTGLGEEFDVPVELAQATKQRGCIVSWAPQEAVLAHPGVGGFLTHSGWNSTLESIVEGKPMICIPFLYDQLVTSRYVSKVWKIGLDMKGGCDRGVVERMVREVMESSKDEFLERAKSLATTAKASVSEGGSSRKDLDRLVQDIKLMRLFSHKS